MSIRTGLLGLVICVTAFLAGTARAGCPWTGPSDTYTTVVRPPYTGQTTAAMPKFVNVSVYNPSPTTTGTVYPNHYTYTQYAFGLICQPAFPSIWERGYNECENFMSPPPQNLLPGEIVTYFFTVTSPDVNRISLTWTHPDNGALVEATFIHDYPGLANAEFESDSFKLERSGCF